MSLPNPPTSAAVVAGRNTPLCSLNGEVLVHEGVPAPHNMECAHCCKSARWSLIDVHTHMQLSR